ncbi:hypothetical protein [Bradyrhizobium sp. CCBAU 51753]|uniref:hypothetical protein n=1 Tax=Bradyrhizobium sp. CCBAU 51753 TaxID=1325100 RepID=UPI00188A0B22|nr:hypothetical protein [Bradyrhizobium sp. CCBAU 51753]
MIGATGDVAAARARKNRAYFFIFLVFLATFLVAFTVFFAFFAFLAMSSSWLVGLTNARREPVRAPSS